MDVEPCKNVSDEVRKEMFAIEEACLAAFLYKNDTTFNVANSDEFKKMFELVARHDIRFKPSSYHEIRVKYLKQQFDSTKLLEESGMHHNDGWLDR
ncbi:hypothetical protein Lal_00041595 [Lupinus albus]|nr:hypothetical protein Lal_00041595 [Lupinus albus]